MKNKTKVWLLIAAFLILIGGGMFATIMTGLEWDFMNLSTSEFETNTYEISENYRNISINVDMADIQLLPGNDESTAVECYEMKSMKHSVIAENGTLLISVEDTRKWYEHIGFYFRQPKVTMTIPKGEYTKLFIKGSTGDVEIQKDIFFGDMEISISTGDVGVFASCSGNMSLKTSTGGIFVKSASAKEMNLRVSTGKTVLNGVRCENLTSIANTGDIVLEDVIAAGKISVERSTGDVDFTACDATEIFVKTTTGDVEGSFLTDKVFITQTNTGKVNVPKSVSGGRCELTTKTGDIKITVD